MKQPAACRISLKHGRKSLSSESTACVRISIYLWRSWIFIHHAVAKKLKALDKGTQLLFVAIFYALQLIGRPRSLFSPSGLPCLLACIRCDFLSWVSQVDRSVGRLFGAWQPMQYNTGRRKEERKEGRAGRTDGRTERIWQPGQGCWEWNLGFLNISNSLIEDGWCCLNVFVQSNAVRLASNQTIWLKGRWICS